MLLRLAVLLGVLCLIRPAVQAQPLLVTSPGGSAPDVAWVRCFAGNLPARTTAATPSQDIVVVLAAGAGLGDAELGAALGPLYEVALAENTLRLALLSDQGVQFAGPFRTQAAFNAAVAEAAASLRAAKPPELATLAMAFNSLAGSWRTLVFAGQLPEVGPELQAYTATYLSQQFRLQRLRAAFWPAEKASGWMRATARATGGAVLPEALTRIVEFVNHTPQDYAEVDWTAPPLSAGFHLYTASLIRRDGTLWSEEIAVTSARGELPEPSQYAAVAEAHRLLAGATPDPAAARAAAERALAVNPRDLTVLRWAARQALEAKDARTAVRLMQALTELEAGDAAFWAGLGEAQLGAGDTAAAEAALLKSWELKPEDPAVAERLARILLLRGDTRGAMPYLDAALKATPRNQEVWFLKADAALTLKNTAALTEALDQGLALGGGHFERRTTLVRLHLAAGRNDAALKQIEAALPLLPADPAIRAEYASMLERLGREEAALGLWRDAAAKDPRNEPAAFAAARLLEKKGDLTGAAQLLDASLGTSPSPRLLALRAGLYQKAGDFYSARAALRKAVAAEPDLDRLLRLAVLEDIFGARSAAAYASLAAALEKAEPRSARHVAALERGYTVALRDRDDQQAATFASLLRAAGRGTGAPGAAPAARGDEIWVRGGLRALAFIAQSKAKSSPEHFFADYARTIVRFTDYAADPVREAYQNKLRDYFARVAGIERSGTSQKAVTVTLSLADRNSRREAEQILDLLGWTVQEARGKFKLQPGEKVAQARRQETAAALAIDEVGMQEALEAGKAFSFEVPVEPARVKPSEKLWHDAFYPGPALPGGFAEALARDPRVAKLYAALSDLDETTLDALVGGVGLKRLAEEYADVLYRYSSALASGPDGMVLPGGAAAEPAWTRLAGVSPKQPRQFVRALLDRNEGKLLAYFFVLSQLDAAHQRFFTATPDRASEFFELLKEAPEFQRGAQALLASAPFSESFGEVPLDQNGNVRVPGSPEVWLTVRSQPGSAVFKSVVRIDQHRSRPLDPESALFLAQQHSRYQFVYPYFATLTGLGRKEFAAFARFAEAMTRHDEVPLNSALGSWHSVMALLCLLKEAGVVDEARSTALFLDTCERFAAAQHDADFTRAALASMRALLDAAAPVGGSADDRLRDVLLGHLPPAQFEQDGAIQQVDPSAVRHAAFRKVLELQKITSLDTLFSMLDAADALVAGKHTPADAIRILDERRAGLLHVAVPQGVRMVGRSGDNLKSFHPEEVAQIVARLKQRAAGKKVTANDFAGPVRDLLAALLPQVRVGLTGLVYAYYLDPADLLVAEDPLLVRKHEFFDLERKGDGLFPESFVMVKSETTGTRAQGGFAQFALSAGMLAAAGGKAGSPGSAPAAAAAIASVRAADWRALRQEDLRLFGLAVRAGREWIVESARDRQVRDALAESTLGLLGLARRRSLLAGIAAGQWQEAWNAVTLGDLYALGWRALRRWPKDAWPSPALAEFRAVAAHNQGERLHVLGPAADDLSGCAHTHLQEQPPYEQFERYLLPDKMAQRVAELKLYLAEAVNDAGLPPGVLAAIAPTAARELAGKLDMSDIRDWRAAIAAYSTVNEQLLKAWLEPK